MGFLKALDIFAKLISVTLYHFIFSPMGFPGGSHGKESACSTGDPEFDPWVRKISWSRE